MNSNMRRIAVVGATAVLGAGLGAYTLREQPVRLQQDHGKVCSFPPVPSRSEQLNSLREREFDVLVIGGGATGAGCVLDAQTRGLNAALVERGDFSSGTSSRSTKLIHGGIRYLQNAIFNLDKEQWYLVKEALAERKSLLDSAPHLSAALPIMIPVYTWWKLPYFYAGTLIYDMVSGKGRLKWSRVISKGTALEEFPMLKDDKLKGAIVYYDGQQNDARMNIMLILSAARAGAVVSNYCKVAGLIYSEDGKVAGAECENTLTGERFKVKAKSVINATGPFTDSIRQMDNPETEKICAPSTGVHIVLPGYFSPQHMGLLDPETSDGRIIFFLPWEGYTVAGTTDTACEPMARPEATEKEIKFILDEIRNYLDSHIKVRRGDVLAAWSGIRPLVRDPAAKNSASLSRNHVIEVSGSGMVTIAGGKWTTYRKMAEDTVDRVLRTAQLSPSSGCVTSSRAVEGAQGYHPNLSIVLSQKYGLDAEVSRHLAHNYGTQAHELAKIINVTGKRWPLVGKRLVSDMPFIESEVRYACRYEYACHVKDFISRRTRLAFLNNQAARECLPKVAEIMGEELGWSEEQVKADVAEAEEFICSMGFKLAQKGLVIDEEKMTPEECERYKQLLSVFESLDIENTGVLSAGELQTAFKQLDIDVTLEDTMSMINEVDSNRNGAVDIEEFMMIMQGGASGRLVDNRIQKLVELKISQDKMTHERCGGGF